MEMKKKNKNFRTRRIFDTVWIFFSPEIWSTKSKMKENLHWMTTVSLYKTRYKINLRKIWHQQKMKIKINLHNNIHIHFNSMDYIEQYFFLVWLNFGYKKKLEMEIHWHALLSSKYLVVIKKQLNMYRRKKTIQLTKKN